MKMGCNGSVFHRWLRWQYLAALAMGFVMLASPAAHSGPSDWNHVKSWVYQLTNYKDGKLDEIAGAGFDLAVVDLARDGGSDFFTRAEIERVQKQGTMILAYFEIGAIENYRPEWKAVPEDLKAGAVGGWPKEQYVKFWDERWWPVVQGRIDQALKAGFDGAYLDLVTGYEEIPVKDIKREELAPQDGGPDQPDFPVCQGQEARFQDRAPELAGTLHVVRLEAKAQPEVPRCHRRLGHGRRLLPGPRQAGQQAVVQGEPRQRPGHQEGGEARAGHRLLHEARVRCGCLRQGAGHRVRALRERANLDVVLREGQTKPSKERQHSKKHRKAVVGNLEFHGNPASWLLGAAEGRCEYGTHLGGVQGEGVNHCL